MGVRKITKSGRKVVGKFPSIKNGCMVWWESQLERDYFYLLESDPDVISYEEQPLTISYYLDAVSHLYTPDLRVIRQDVKQIVEVKMKETAEKAEYVELFRRVEPICQRNGYEFVVATEETIRVQPRLDNIKLLYKYCRTAVTSAHQILLYSMFSGQEALSIQEIITGFSAKGISVGVVYSLIYHGILSVDLMQPIRNGSAVRLSQAFHAQRRKTA